MEHMVTIERIKFYSEPVCNLRGECVGPHGLVRVNGGRKVIRCARHLADMVSRAMARRNVPREHPGNDF